MKIVKYYNLLFKFNNGKGGKNKIISQAINYQKNAKIIFKNEKYYHIIIIRSKELGNALKPKINEELIKKNKFVNFAILSMDNILSICNEQIIPTKKQSKEDTKQSKEGKGKIELEISELKDIREKLNEFLEKINELINNKTSNEKENN